MADTYEPARRTDVGTHRHDSTATRRVSDRLRRADVDRAIAPVAFVGLTLGMLAVGIVSVLTAASLLPSTPTVGVLSGVALLGLAAATPNLAAGTIRLLAGRRD